MALQPFGDGGWVTYALMAMTALSSSVAFPNAGAMMSRAIDEHNQGQIAGLNNAAGAFARVVGPQAASFFFSAVNVNGPYWLGAAIVAPAIWLAIAAGRAVDRQARA